MANTIKQIRAEANLAKRIQSTRYGQILTLKQFVRCLVEEGFTIVQVQVWKRKKGLEMDLVRGLFKGNDDFSYFEGTTTKTGMDYAEQLLKVGA